MSCKYCNNLDPKGHKDTQTMDDGQPGTELSLMINLEVAQKAKKQGCRYCSLLCKTFEYFVPKPQRRLKKYLPEYDFHIELQENKPVDVDVVVSSPVSDDISDYITSIVLFHIYNPTSIPIPDFPTLGTLGVYSTSSDSDHCFEFIQEHIHSCITSHDTCAQKASITLPKRVLSIGSDDAKEIKLFEPSYINARYAALSHCWGGHQPLTTTQATLEQRKTGVNWDDIPATFQDAISVARRLRIAWIWIDSLCIIQDVKEDWEMESAKMCDYYENAFITISAASSPNGTVPFLRKRDRSWWPRNFKFQNSDDTMSTVCARQHSGEHAFKTDAIGPISSRGWVWQENILSTRILHYAEGELIWECKSEICSEDGATLSRTLALGLTQNLLKCRENPYLCWHELVQSYSSRDLTFESDRLPALSGVASKVQQIVSSQYLAGLWKNNMAADLAWAVDYNPVEFHPEYSLARAALPSKYRAPSWSWVSVGGWVYYKETTPRDSFHSSISIVDGKCTVPGLNPFGEVTDGFLTLSGSVMQATLSCDDPEDHVGYKLQLEEDEDDNLEGDSYLSPEEDLEDSGSWESIDSPGRVRFLPDSVLVECDVHAPGFLVEKTARRLQDGDIPGPFSTPVYCLQIGYQLEEGKPSYYIMVLGQSNTVTSAYTRLGLAKLDWDDQFKGQLMTVKIV